MSTTKVTLRRTASGYITADGTLTIRPAYAPSLRGGSVARPSSWIVAYAATSAHVGTPHPTLARAREAVAALAAGGTR